METKSNQNFYGIITPASWGKGNEIKKLCLYTDDGEDILLDHDLGIKKLKPFINKYVKVTGKMVSDDHDGRKVLVKRVLKKDKVVDEETSGMPLAS